MIFVLMKFMEKRERFNPKPFMVVYNFICVCLATYCFYGMLKYYFLKKPFLYCSDIDFDTENAKTLAHVRRTSLPSHCSMCMFSICKNIGSLLIPSCSFSASRTVKWPSFMCTITAASPSWSVSSFMCILAVIIVCLFFWTLLCICLCTPTTYAQFWE